MPNDLGVWDCHTHVFGDPTHFPLAEERRYTPQLAWLPALRAHLEAVGATRVVLVQPTVYGHDHRCLLRALDTLGAMAVGVAACPPPGGSLPEHPRMVGLRVDLRGPWTRAHGETLRRAAGIAAGAGAHLEAQIGPAGLPALSESLGDVAVPLVLDHLAGLSAESPATEVAAFDGLLARPNVYAKLSALERIPGDETGALALVARVAHRAPDKLLWGSDWPHTPLHPPPEERHLPLPFRSVDDRAAAEALERALGRAAMAFCRETAPARVYGRSPAKPSTHALLLT